MSPKIDAIGHGEDIKKAETVVSEISKAEMVPVKTQDGKKDTEVILDYAGSHDKTDPDEVRLVRKLDIWLLPILWLVVFLNNFQRQSISVARLDRMDDELGFTGTQFSDSVAIHYVGSILGQVPANLILTRIRPSWGITIFFGGCSVLTMLMAVLRNYPGMVLLRFFMGLIGAPIWPASLFVLNTFYTRKEVATRIGFVYSAIIISAATQGLIAAPIFSELGGVNGLSGWRWMYIIMGAIPGGLAVVAVFILPNDPLNTWWLKPKEREMAHSRIAHDTVEKSDDVSILQGLKQIVSDKHVWIFALSHHLQTATSSFRIFLPTLMETLGFNTTITLVITCPPYILAALISVAIGLSSGRWNERTWHITTLKCISMGGFIIGCVSMNTVARMVAMFLFVGATYAVTPLNMGWVGITCGQTKEKRAASLAFVNTFASMSLIWTPYLWPTNSAPRYILPLAASAGACLITITCVFIIRFSLMRENKRIRRMDEDATLFYAY